MFAQDFELINLWYDLKAGALVKALNPWVHCAFGMFEPWPGRWRIDKKDVDAEKMDLYDWKPFWCDEPIRPGGYSPRAWSDDPINVDCIIN